MARNHPLRELYLSRLREFYRQPARIFWVYGFPTLLAVCLRLAFKSRPPESIQVDLIRGGGSTDIEYPPRDYDVNARAEGRPGLILEVEPREVALKRLRPGKTPLVIGEG